MKTTNETEAQQLEVKRYTQKRYVWLPFINALYQQTEVGGCILSRQNILNLHFS